MKITVEIDATPQEMRAMLGLPNIEPLQQEIMEKIREKTLPAIETDDPMQLMKLLMPSNDQFKSMEALQTKFWEAMTKNTGFSKMGDDSAK